MPPKFLVLLGFKSLILELHRDVFIVTAKLMNLNNGARWENRWVFLLDSV